MGSAGNHPPKTGAVEINTLGYDAGTGRDPMDAVYRISVTFPHTASSLVLSFDADVVGINLSPFADETWGIDNFELTLVPEPSPTWLFAFALTGLLFIRPKAQRVGRPAALQQL